MSPTLIIFVVIGLVVVYLLFLYNALVRLREQIKEAFSQIDVQLKRRAELIPNLLETVKGYAKHEKDVLENVTKARSALLDAKGAHDKAVADDFLTQALGKLFAVAEAYPQLRANENFLQLQKELGDTEDKVAYARQYYNTSVMEYNVKIKSIPAVFIANSFGFKEEEFFKTDSEEERKAPKVHF
ncbi:MAG: LemA family protein [Patescibacteria group bacterium]|nr:LemA family protein [Patescibacteria group bacterium]